MSLVASLAVRIDRRASTNFMGRGLKCKRPTLAAPPSHAFLYFRCFSLHRSFVRLLANAFALMLTLIVQFYGVSAMTKHMVDLELEVSFRGWLERREVLINRNTWSR